MVAVLATAALAVVAGWLPLLAAGSQGPEDASPLEEELRVVFGRAEALARAGELDDARPLLDWLVEELGRLEEAGRLGEEGRLLLVRSLAWRALAELQDGDRRGADRDLDRLIEVAPDIGLPRGFPRLLRERYEARLDRVVGFLNLGVVPADAEVTVDGEEVATEAGEAVVHLLPGTHRVAAERPGHFPASREVEIRAGRRQSLLLELPRASAVIRFRSRPPGAKVVVDADVVGTTWPADGPAAGRDGSARDAPPGGARPEAVSAEMVVEGLMPGRHAIELTREGYRPFTASFEVPELSDYDLGVLEMERSSAVLALRGLPPGARVTVDGEPRRPTAPAEADVETGAVRTEAPRLDLGAGQHHLFVSHAAGVFEATVTVRDRETSVLEVDLRPAITWLGTVGGDELAARSLADNLRSAVSELPDWTFLDRSTAAAGPLRGLGIDAATLADAVAAGADAPSGVDWKRLQRAFDDVPGSVYVIGALSDREMAVQADLWLLAAAPGPAAAAPLAVSLNAEDVRSIVASALGAALPSPRPVLGALLVDSGLTQRPVVADVAPDGPGATAGLAVGDEIVSIAGTPPRSAVEAMARLGAMEPGAGVVVEVAGAGGADAPRVVTVRLGSSPVTVASSEPQRLWAAVWARAESERFRPTSQTPGWVLRLDQALAHLATGEPVEAIGVLQEVRTPPGAGRQGGVIDYWLARALLAAGEEAGPDWRERARTALERVAADTRSRLYHADGPRAAPRARALLEGMDRLEGMDG